MTPPSPADWKLFLRELDRWVKLHGSAQVPQLTTTRVIDGKPYPLGRRVNYWRQQYRAGAVDSGRIAELEGRAGWTWGAVNANRHDRLWQDRYDQLRQLVDDNGTLSDLPRQMHNWLYQQRLRHRDGELTTERETLLRQIPGALEGFKSQVPTFVAAAQAWLRAGGRKRSMADLTFETSIDIDGDDYPLGRRAWYYRRRRNGDEGTFLLEGDEVTVIEQLRGWTWEPSS